MAESVETTSFARSGRFRILLGAVALAVAGIGLWWWLTRGYEATDDAQIDAHVTQISARVSGPVLTVPVKDNQLVEAGTILLEIDPRDYQVAVDKARAELAHMEAVAVAAHSDVPVTTTTAAGNVSTAEGTVARARSAAEAAAKEVEAAQARLSAAEARLREADANATRTARDVERLRGLLAKDEVSQQQYDAAVVAAEGQRAATDTARAQIAEAEAGIRVSESRRAQAQVGEQQARTSLRTARTAPNQVTATRARATSAEAQVAEAKATLAQAELNLQYTVVKAPARGVVSKKTINPGQVVQSGQPLMAIVQHEDVWVTANFKETQLEEMRPGQPALVEVDAYGSRTFTGHVDSIAAATGARFSLLPPENATGNFVKVVQRVPVKIVLDQGQDPEHLLRPGMSVTPTVYTDR
ncbi:MAG: HlyD family efflux transporter periplasmic adaptor subunit [Luteitalea sp.]|nr:HlyD family efflux transporter periplasmic adaptor subunit [Luteitalea sp.]